MDSRVRTPLASAPERARALQALLDAHGPEMDRRRELTPEVVDALVEQDMLRLLLPRTLGGQEIALLEYCRACEAVAWADASAGWFVNQSNVSSASSAAAMPHEAAATIFAGPRSGLAWGARHNNSTAIRVAGGYQLSGTWSFGGGRHTTGRRPQRRAESRRHATHPLWQAGRRFLPVPARQATIIDDWYVLGLRAWKRQLLVKDLSCLMPTRRRATWRGRTAGKGRAIPLASTRRRCFGFLQRNLASRGACSGPTPIRAPSRAPSTPWRATSRATWEIGSLEAVVGRARLPARGGRAAYEARAAGTPRRASICACAPEAGHDLRHERGHRRLARSVIGPPASAAIFDRAPSSAVLGRHARQPAPFRRCCPWWKWSGGTLSARKRHPPV